MLGLTAYVKKRYPDCFVGNGAMEGRKDVFEFARQIDSLNVSICLFGNIQLKDIDNYSIDHYFNLLNNFIIENTKKSYNFDEATKP